MKKFRLNKDGIMCAFIIFALLFFDKRADLLVSAFDIPVSFNIIAIILLSMCGLSLCFRKKIKFDMISLSLLILLLFYVTQFIFIGGYTNNLFNFVDISCCLLVYLYFRNICPQNISTMIINILLIFGFALSIEVIFTRVDLFINELTTYQIKGFLQLPIGGSNYIASFLVIVFIGLFFHKISEKRIQVMKTIIMFLIFVSIVLTESRGALFTVLLFMIFVFSFRSLLKLYNHQFFQKNKKKILYISISITTLLLIVGIYMISNIEFEKLDSLTSGRISIYLQYLDAIKCKPIFGWGFYYEQYIGNLAHNFVLSNLLYGGVIGLIISLCPLCYLAYQVIVKKQRRNALLVFILYICAFINSVLEPNLGTIKFDIFFWMLIGLLINDSTIKFINIKLTILNVFKNNSKRKKKFSLLLIFFMIFIFINLGLFQYNSRPTKYISTQTIKLLPNDLSDIDVYSIGQTRESVYNLMLFKNIKRSDLNTKIQQEYSSDMSYTDVLESVYVEVLDRNSSILIRVETENEQLSSNVCSYTIKNIEKIIQKNNTKDKYNISLMINSNYENRLFMLYAFDIFAIVLFYEIILIVIKFRIEDCEYE